MKKCFIQKFFLFSVKISFYHADKVKVNILLKCIYIVDIFFHVFIRNT